MSAKKKSDPKNRKSDRKSDKKSSKKSGKAKKKSATFSARVEADEKLKTPVVVLEARGKGVPGGALAVRICPDMGSNLYSLQVDGKELLFIPDSVDELRDSGGGTPILFPIPGRVRDGHFTFGGHRFEFIPNKGPNYIHGPARYTSFYFDPPTTTSSGARLSTWYEWDERQPDFARFPIRHRLNLDFELGRKGVEFKITVINHDRTKLPFGFGLHPWFRVPGRKEDIHICVPAEHRMEAVELLPTGRLVKVANTPYDLRTPVPVSQLNLDDVYFGVKPKRPPTIEWRDTAVALTLGASKEFGHMVVFTPDRPTFCMENQTSSADAHNLHAGGRRRESGLITVAPGKRKKATVQWTVATDITAP